METWTLSESHQLSSSIATRSATFIVSGHRRTRSDQGAMATAGAQSSGRPPRLTQRLSLDTRPTASTSKRPGASRDQCYLTGKLDSPLALQRRERRGVEPADEDSGSLESSSDDERVKRGSDRRPQSAWNSHSGRRPQFTFSDMSTTGADVDDELDRKSKSKTRRKSMSSCSGSSLASTQQVSTTKRSTRSRPSHIPVKSERLQPANVGHNDASTPRRHSVYSINNICNSSAMFNLSRDRQTEESTSGCDNSTSSSSESFRRRSLTDDQHTARMRVLARLAKSDDQPEAEMMSSAVSRRPRKLDPILSPNVVTDDVDRLCLDEPTASKVAAMEDDSDDVTSANNGGRRTSGIRGRNAECRPRPVMSRRAKEIMLI